MKCSHCKLDKTIDNFYTSKNTKNGFRYECKVCSKKHSAISFIKHKDKMYLRNKKWNKENPEKRKKLDIKSKLNKYKLYEFEVDLMSLLQKNKCAICKENCDSLVIDHSHITGMVRGLLCSKHNAALGMFKDSRELLQNAIDYLNKAEKSEYE